MDTQLETLGGSVEKTLVNLNGKRDFLVEQQHQYTVIRDRLHQLKNRKPNESGDDEKGEVYGDIIISANKVFLNIGYEYYMEKTVVEALEFVDDKLNLMEEAIEQFNLKIEEANGTLKNLRNLASYAEADSKPKENDDDGVAEEDDVLPTMEIREELDEDGNVISGSVALASTEKERKNLESMLMATNENQSNTQTIEGKLGEEINFDKSFEENLKTGINKKKITEVEEIEPVKSTVVDTENIYTFDDLVQHLDEQDEVDDGTLETDDVDYNFQNYQEGSLPIHQEYDDNDDEEWYDEDSDDNDFSIVPGIGGSFFMDQINKLRATKGQVLPEPTKEEEPVQVNVVENKIEEIIETEIPEPKHEPVSQKTEKSILKKSQKKTKKKKSVGFAQSLDIHEVESFKKETKAQTFSFPRPNMDLYSMVQDKILDDTNNPNLNEFDSDLFAKLIGVQDSEEIHDNYKDQIEGREADLNEEAAEEQHQEKQKRVSRFKKDRSFGNEPAVSPAPLVTEKESSGRAVSELVVEKEFVEPPVEVMSSQKKQSRFAQRQTKKQPLVSDIVETPVKETIVEKEAPVKKTSRFSQRRSKQQSVVSEIVEKTTNVEARVHDHRGKHIFNKSMKSLNKPESCAHKKDLLPKELFDDDDDDDEYIEEPEVIQPKIEEIFEVDTTGFPQEIKEAIEKAGKNEESVRVANVDYSALVDNMDDMTKAYALGMYDDDLEENPGALLEKMGDFDGYNKQAEELKEEVIEFRKKNPLVPFDEDELDDDENSPMMTDIVEKSIPESYSQIEEQYGNDLGLYPDKLSESVSAEYHQMRESMLHKMKEMSLNEDKEDDIVEHVIPALDQQGKAVEPVDDAGNPIKVSRFRSQMMNLDINK